MLLDKLGSKVNIAGTDVGNTRGKMIGEFSNKEWDKLLDKVDNATEAYKEDLKRREEEALKQRDEQEQKERELFQKQQNEKYEFEKNVIVGGTLRNIRFQKQKDDVVVTGITEEKLNKTDSEKNVISEEAIKKIVENRGSFPYSSMADENGIIEHNGVIFTGDKRTNSLCLGDMTEFDNILTIPLSEGGYLKVNCNNIDELSRAIDMFSPEDINRIMRAIAQHNKLKQIEQQIEDETSGLQVLKRETGNNYFA